VAPIPSDSVRPLSRAQALGYPLIAAHTFCAAARRFVAWVPRERAGDIVPNGLVDALESAEEQ